MAIVDPPEVEVDGPNGTRLRVPGTWRPPSTPILADLLDQAKQFIAHRLKPAEESEIRSAILPLALSLKVENKLISEENEAEFYRQMIAELVRHLKGTPLDIVRAACDAHVRVSEFFPTVAALLKHVTPELEKRQGQEFRIKRLCDAQAAPKKKPEPAPFVAESEEVRLRADIERWRNYPGGFMADALKRRAIASEQRLAELESREPEEWASGETGIAAPLRKAEVWGFQTPASVARNMATNARLAELAKENRARQGFGSTEAQPPESVPDEIPE